MPAEAIFSFRLISFSMPLSSYVPLVADAAASSYALFASAAFSKETNAGLKVSSLQPLMPSLLLSTE